jgi:Icc-related predicted phosphoesterase
MKIVHTTDPHLDCAGVNQIQLYKESLMNAHADAIIITGDISNGSHSINALSFYEDLGCPVYFVCGNHDYYHTIINLKREFLSKNYTINNLQNNKPVWLGNESFISLDSNTALVGHDGWYDAEEGTPEKTTVFLADFLHIKDFSICFHSDKKRLIKKFKSLAKESAEHIYNGIEQAVSYGHKTVIVATHVPPFKENSKYNNKMSADDFLPFFCSRIMGKMLLKASKKFKEANLIVLCGHTHHDAFYSPANNVKVITGHSVYGKPCISGLLKKETDMNGNTSWSYKEISISRKEDCVSIPLV